ncbi:phage tail tip fiber protein [Sphingomonas yabuuchiae]|uniref:DUF1983 domain-containing protein n=1 Tax=Sphingomonas yabuuchiae TaxID=172044 RepID=A0AA40ZYY5_9SPHN|nr:DUF1983 domain-containing protein [Sphingomonas yabuuchiae]MBB4611486.1 hypothetical protein [Sphingomonas yabuuchiae]MBN3556928.1 DUF1983 domain-containing protein [Sphingomonas yabuuchiae]
MAKAIKIAGAVVVGAGLILATGGIAAGFTLGAALGAGSGVLGLSIGGLILAGSTIATLGSALDRPKVPQVQSDRLYAQLNPREFRKTVLGQTAMPVDVRHEEWEGTNQEWCRWIVGHASHGIDGVEEIWFGTELAWSATTGVTAKYRGYFFVDAVVLEGSPANALALSNQWNGTRRLTGCAYSAWRFKTTGNTKKAESPFSGGPPNRITVIGRGAKLYDPRRDSTVPGGNGPMRADDQSTWRFVTDDGVTIGENLPLQILRMALGSRIRNPVTGELRLATGSGVPKRRINMASFIVAANLADEQVNRSAGGTEPRYHGACVLSEGDEPRTWYEMLCAACNARFRDTGGKLSIDIAHNDFAAAATDDGLTTDDVVGPHRWEPDASLDAIPNIVRGKYVDASAPSLYQLIDYPEIRISSLDGVDRILPLDLGAVESVSQAQRVAKQALQRKQYPRTFTAPFDIRAWKYPVGALVPFTYAPLSFKRVLFRVREQELGQDGQCVMTLSYEHPSFYAWDADDRAPVMAADPIVYDASNNPLILAIADAAKTAEWSNVSGTEGVVKDIKNAGDKADAVTANLVGRRLTGLLQSAIDGQAALNIDYGSAAISAASALAKQNLVAIQTLGTRIEEDGSKVAESFQQLTSRLDDNEKKVAGINVKGEVEAGMTQLRRTIANANFASFEAVDKRIANFGEAVSAWQVKEEKARVDANSAVIKSVDDIGARVSQEGLDRQASIKDLREVLIDKDGNLIAQRIQNLGTRVTVILNGETVTLESAIQTVDKSYRTATGTVAESVKKLTARLDNVGDATLEQSMKAVADKIKGLSAEYTLKVQTTQNGKKYVAGMGIAIDNGVSAFAISTDAFTVVLPDGSDRQLIHADKDGVYMPNVRVDTLKAKSIDTPALADYAIRRSYSAELAGNVPLPASDGGRVRYLTLGVTKQLADSSIRIECNFAPRPGRDYAGYFVFGRTTDGQDVVMDTKWYWVASCVINGFRSVRMPVYYGRVFAGLPAGSHSFWIDFVAYGGGNDQGFMEAGSNFYVEEIKV